MTARAGLRAYILVMLSCVPVVVLMAMNVPWSFLAAALPLAAIVLAPFLFVRWIPRRQVRKWLETHDIEVDEKGAEYLAHLAAHSGLPYTNPTVLEEAFNRSSFYVSRKNVEELLYLQNPEFEDAGFREAIRRLDERPSVELVRAAMDAGATSQDILRRYNRGSVPMNSVLESFAEGMPEEYFLAMVGGD